MWHAREFALRFGSGGLLSTRSTVVVIRYLRSGLLATSTQPTAVLQDELDVPLNRLTNSAFGPVRHLPTQSRNTLFYSN
jgi:hypothetical protein